jgi:hypothetical protein
MPHDDDSITTERRTFDAAENLMTGLPAFVPTAAAASLLSAGTEDFMRDAHTAAGSDQGGTT